MYLEKKAQEQAVYNKQMDQTQTLRIFTYPLDMRMKFVIYHKIKHKLMGHLSCTE